MAIDLTGYDIDLADLTDGVTVDTEHNVTGNGIFDKLMATVNENINAQYAAGRIKGTDVATVYLGAMQTAIQQSIQFLLQKDISQNQGAVLEADLRIKEAQEAEALAGTIRMDAESLTKRTLQEAQKNLVDAQTLSEGEKKLLITRQKDGFDKNDRKEALKLTLDSWAVAYAAGSQDSFPDQFITANITNTINDVYTDLSLPVSP